VRKIKMWYQELIRSSMCLVRRSSRLNRKERVNYNYNRCYTRTRPYRKRVDERFDERIKIEKKNIEKKRLYYCEKCDFIKNDSYCLTCDRKLYSSEDFESDDLTIVSE
jgi:hypothetical protein